MDPVPGKKNISLSASEKDRIKESILFFMQTHPLKGKGKESIFIWAGFSLFFTRYSAATLTLIVLILFGTGSALASNALPNEFLYPLKRGVNERVAGWIAIGAKAEAELHADLAMRRLEEAEKLAVQGELDAETSARIRGDFVAHSESARLNVARLRSNNGQEDALDIAGKMESGFAVHDTVLAQIKTDNSVLDGISSSVNAQVSSAAEARIDAESTVRSHAKFNSAPIAEAARKKAEKRIKKTRDFAKSKKVNGAVTIELDHASENYAEGEAYVSVNAYNNAVVAFKNGEKKAEGARLAVRVKDELGIDVMREVNASIAADTALMLNATSSSGVSTTTDSSDEETKEEEADRPIKADKRDKKGDEPEPKPPIDIDIGL